LWKLAVFAAGVGALLDESDEGAVHCLKMPCGASRRGGPASAEYRACNRAVRRPQPLGVRRASASLREPWRPAPPSVAGPHAKTLPLGQRERLPEIGRPPGG